MLGQRRNQKVIEGASPRCSTGDAGGKWASRPSPGQGGRLRSAGTVEFVAGQDRSFFLDEHAPASRTSVTELILSVDLVEEMIRSAYGLPLPGEGED